MLKSTCSPVAEMRWGFFSAAPSPGRSAETQVSQYSLGGFAAFKHRRHDEVRTAHHVATCEHFGVRCLKGRRGRRRHAYPPRVVQPDVMLVKPVRRARQEAERNDHRISRQHL